MTSVNATNFMIKSLDLAVPMFVCVFSLCVAIISIAGVRSVWTIISNYVGLRITRTRNEWEPISTSRTYGIVPGQKSSFIAKAFHLKQLCSLQPPHIFQKWKTKRRKFEILKCEATATRLMHMADWWMHWIKSNPFMV